MFGILRIACVLILAPGLLFASERVALVIGNAQYDQAATLKNPINDANDISATLRNVGFEVTLLKNANRQAIMDGLETFSKASRNASIAVIYFAGHGIEVSKVNYLVPTDASLSTQWQVPFETVELDYAVLAASGARDLSMVILDACRDNPFASSIQATDGFRSVGRGLAEVEPPRNTIVAYAAKAGTLAMDGTGRNSPYAEALIGALNEPQLEIGLFRKVRDTVLETTNYRQEPFWYGSLSSRLLFLNETPPVEEPPAFTPEPKPEPAPALTSGSTVDPVKTALALALVRRADSASEIEAILQVYQKFPEVQAAARDKLMALMSEDTLPLPAAPKPLEPKAGIKDDPLQDAPTLLAAAPAAKEADPPKPLVKSEVRDIQRRLAAFGLSPGPADGVAGPRTAKAISDFQQRRGELVTGYADRAFLETIRAAVSDKEVDAYLAREKAIRDAAERKRAEAPKKAEALEAAVVEEPVLPTPEELEAQRLEQEAAEREARRQAYAERLLKRQQADRRSDGASSSGGSSAGSSGGGSSSESGSGSGCSGLTC